MDPAPGRRIGGDLALLVCAAGWGLTFPLIRDAVSGDVSPLMFVAVRFSLAVVVLAPLVFYRRLAFGWPTLRDGALVGLFLFAGFAAQTIGLTTVDAARSAFLTSFYVLFTPLLAWLLTRRRQPRALTLGLALAFLGGAVYTGAGGLGGGVGLGRGDLWTLLGALAFSAQMVALSAVVRRHGALALVTLQCAVTAAAAAVLSLLVEEPVLRLSGNAILALLFTGIIASALLLGLQAWGQSIASAPRAAVLFASEPIWAAGFTWLLWGQGVTPREMAGGALIVGGILLAELGPRRPPAGARPEPGPGVPRRNSC